MIIICEHCGTDHRIADESFRKSKYSILVCRGCRKHIPIILCPVCRAPHIRHDSDREVLCINCGASVINGLTGDAGEKYVPESSLPPPVAGDDTSSCLEPCIQKINNMPEKPQEISEDKKSGAAVNHKAENVSPDEFPADTYFHPPFLRRLTLQELFQVAGESLKPNALIPAIIAACIMMIMAAVPRPRTVPYNGLNFFHGFSNFLFPAAYFFIYLTASAVICRMILGRVFSGKISVNGTGLFVFRAAFPVLAVNGIFVMFAQCLVAYAVKIPYRGPVFFGLALLPLYCFSLLFMLLGLAGFWFLPPVVAHRYPSFTSIPQTLFSFVSRHGFSLCYIIPILILASLTVVVPLAILHYQAMSFVLGYASAAVGQGFDSIMGAIPVSLSQSAVLFFPMKLPGILAVFSSSSPFQTVVVRLAGLSMWVITMVCLGLSISIMSVMSVHVYLFMESGPHTGKGRFPVILSLFSLVLPCYLFMKFI